MRPHVYLLVALLLSAVAANDGVATPGQAIKNEKRPAASSKVVSTKGRHPVSVQAPKNGGLLGVLGKVGRETPGGSKGTSSINGTGMGAPHTLGVSGTGVGGRH